MHNARVMTIDQLVEALRELLGKPGHFYDVLLTRRRGCEPV